MLIDCDGCAMRGPGCPDCVVTALLGAAPSGVELDEVECQALAVLAEGGLVPPLRLVPAAPRAAPGPQGAQAAGRRGGQPAGPGQAQRPERGRAGRGGDSGELPHRRARHAAG